MTQSVILSGTLPEIQRSNITKELKEFVIPWEHFRIWDSASNALLGAAAGTDDLGLALGTWASASPHILSSNSSGTTVTQYARCIYPLPAEYDDGQRVRIRVHGKVDVAAQVSNTIDIVAYESNKEAGIGSDLVTTAATAFTTSYADIDFSLTPTGLVAGDLLDFRIAIALDDTAGANACIARLGCVSLMCDVRG